MKYKDHSEFKPTRYWREYKGAEVRFVSLIIDNIIISIFISIFMSLIGFDIRFGVVLGRFIWGSPSVTTQGVPGLAEVHGIVPWWINFLFFLIYICYFTLMEGLRGQTIGKMITKTKVVSEDGNPISLRQALIRNLFRIIDGIFSYLIGYILIWRSAKDQRLGDRIAKTVVIKK